MFVPQPNVEVPVGRFSVSVRFLHDFQLRIPYVVRKPGSNGPISAAAFCPATGRGANSEFLHEPVDQPENAMPPPRPHAVVEFSSQTKDLLGQLGIPGITEGAFESKSMEPEVFTGGQSIHLAEPPSMAHSSYTDQSAPGDSFTPVPESNRGTSPGSVESLADMLSTNALMNAGPVGFATAQACECGWLTVDVKVRFCPLSSSSLLGNPQIVLSCFRPQVEEDTAGSGLVGAAAITYKTRWVRTTTRPIVATTSATLGPFTATQSMFPNPVLGGRRASITATTSYPVVWNDEIPMKIDVSIADSTVDLLYHNVDGFTDMMTDWSTVARNAWPWLRDPKMMDQPRFFVPYSYSANIAFRVLILFVVCSIVLSWRSSALVFVCRM